MLLKEIQALVARRQPGLRRGRRSSSARRTTSSCAPPRSSASTSPACAPRARTADGKGAADEQEEQVVAEGDGGTDGAKGKSEGRRGEGQVGGKCMDINNFDAIEIGLASSKKIRGWSSRRGHEAGDDQLPHAEAREGRPLLRAHLRSDQGLGVLLRQVQAGPLQGHRLRALRRRGHPLQGPPRAHGPHRPGRARLPHLVLQGRPQPDRLPDRHGSQGAREGPLLRRLDRHLGRRGGPRRRTSTSSRRKSRRSSTATAPSASSAPRSCASRSSAASPGSRATAPSRSFDDEDELWAEGLGFRTRRSSRTPSARSSLQGARKKALDSEIADTEAYLDDADRAHGARSGRSSRR